MVKLYVKTLRGWFEYYPTMRTHEYPNGIVAYNRYFKGNVILRGFRAEIVKGYLLRHGKVN